MAEWMSILTEDYGLEDKKAERIVRWIRSKPDREQEILLGRLAGMSMRAIARDIGVSHPTVSQTIGSWDGLKYLLTED